MTDEPKYGRPGRRDRSGGIVRDKLDELREAVEREPYPARLMEQAQALQTALDAKRKDPALR
ncbi:hypothetical protein ACSV9I_12805 [Rhizobium sp. G187]|uniref:hypothetical protein n=1 Tax=unclassified Rhizobium TaxID=2613769 RepID=UPI0006B9C262|nr:hypothetical protein [Rhizobium sp. AAP43]KPF44953.1 hypothetical protein IP76_08835 [Rhizobium sp. AAP43]